jgi:hypothetical protein
MTIFEALLENNLSRSYGEFLRNITLLYESIYIHAL